jgi:O-antigen ligase
MLRSFDLDKTFQNLLILLAFLTPLTVAGANAIIVILCLLWLCSGDYKNKFNLITNDKLMLASLAFFCMHILGLAWTEDLEWGLHIVHKMWYFLGLFPILFTIVRKEYITKYISAFLLAISITEVFSYLVWFELIPPFKNATVINPTPFMSHVSYNPILAFATYIVLHEIFFNKKITNLIFALYSFFAISMSINMFITGGRAGQVAFFVMLGILIFQVLDKQRIKSIILILIVIPGIFFAAYQGSSLFKVRVDMAFHEVATFKDQKDTSVGLRINMAINSWQIIKKNPVFGVGTGDFPTEYAKVNQVNSPGLPNVSNPHNMYSLVTSQLGLIGLISLLSIFYYQLKFAYKSSSSKFIRNVGATLPLLFLVMMLSDSYLLGHYTTLMYVFFSSFLYQDFEKN